MTDGRPPARGGTAALLLVWAATRAAVLCTIFKVWIVPGPDVTVDVAWIYRGWYEVLHAGLFPWHDETWQYPPAAALAILSPGLLLPFLDYATGFVALACAADAVVLVLLLRATRPVRRPTARRGGVWAWVVGVPLLGPTAYCRYDVMVTAVAVAALLALARRPRTAGALAGFGALLKVWPALLLIGVAKGRATRRSWATALVTGVAVLGVFAATMPGALAFLRFQGGRGTEVESLGALVFHVARHFGWPGAVMLHYGSMEFLGPWVGAVSTAALGLSVLALGWLLLWRLRAVHWGPATAADAALTAVLLFTTTSRVISPQYMIWLVGLAAVCLVLRDSALRLPSVLVLAATGVTFGEFPLGFADVVASDATGLTLMFLRNGLLVAASALAARSLWRSTGAGRGTRAGEDEDEGEDTDAGAGGDGAGAGAGRRGAYVPAQLSSVLRYARQRRVNSARPTPSSARIDRSTAAS